MTIPPAPPAGSGPRDVPCAHCGTSLPRAAEDRGAHPEAVGVTWAVSFQQVEQHSPAAVELLRLCAYLAPEAIPEWLFVEAEEDEEDVDGAEGAEDGDQEDAALAEEEWEEIEEEDEGLLPPALSEAASDPLAWNAALAALRRFSLLDRQAETETLSLHRLVQVVVQEALPRDERRAWAERAVRLISAVFPVPEYEQWEVCEWLLPHALMCARHIAAWRLAFPEAAYVLNQAGSYLHRRARYAEALPLYQRALTILEQALGPEHPDVATSLNNLAELYRAQGQYEEALPLYQRALAIFERALGPNHPYVAFALNGLADLSRRQGQSAHAHLLAQRALSIREQSLGPTHSDVAESLMTLGELASDQVQTEDALPLFQRALAIREQALLPTHPSVAESLAHLGRLVERQGHPEEALPLLERALTIWEQTVPDHPDALACREILAALLRSLGRDDEAVLLEARAQMNRTEPPAAS